MMQAGRMRWSALIESPPTTKLASGAPSSTWVTVATRRCKVMDLGASKANDGVGQMQLSAVYEVRMRLTPGILTSYRLTISGAPFNGLVMKVVWAQDTLDETILNCVIRSNQ